MKKILFALFAVPSMAYAQNIDTTDIYKERSDSLDAAVFTSRSSANTLPKGRELRTEVISASGLCKMACCNLAESFENSASVTVGYSDAVTGARQIRLLGLSGTYTQMLDENRPVMRGLSAPWGLSYVPGQWLESIQIAKGASSVINGVESMTGQINMEHRKPTDEIPLYVNYSAMADTKMDFNIASSQQIGQKWSTVLLGHVSGNIKGMDHNDDGFLDDPMQLQFNLSNRWLYYSPSGLQIRFGIRAIRDTRKGGEIESGKAAYDKDSYNLYEADPWGSDILNQSIDGYLKVGVPLNEDNSQNIAAVLDYNYQDMQSYFGATDYLAGQHSGFFNLLYQNQSNDSHHFTLGLTGFSDAYRENMDRIVLAHYLYSAGATAPASIHGCTFLGSYGMFGEYTYHCGEKFSAIAALSAQWYNKAGFKVSPRLTLKYAPIDEIVLRANAGRGLRYSNPLVDNIGVFSTSKSFTGSYADHTLEDAWVAGGNLTFYLPFGASSDTYVSFDYFHTEFSQQKIADYEYVPGTIAFYNLKDMSGARSFTDTYQLDFSVEPLERFTVNLTGRYTDAKQTLMSKGLLEKPMTSRYKAVLNLQYATRLNKWIFDFTASLNGPCRVYDFMKEMKDSSGNELYKDGLSPVFPMLYAQVTKRFKMVDIYIGGENLTNYRQKVVLVGTRVSGDIIPSLPDFDASCVWGPIMGVKLYAGVRLTLWKKE